MKMPKPLVNEFSPRKTSRLKKTPRPKKIFDKKRTDEKFAKKNFESKKKL